jgi:hypothetical protein
MVRFLCTPCFKGAFSSTDQMGTRNLKLIWYIRYRNEDAGLRPYDTVLLSWYFCTKTKVPRNQALIEKRSAWKCTIQYSSETSCFM